MAAFDQVTKTATQTRLRARRANFLAAPQRVLSRAVIDFSRFRTNLRYVRADVAAGGDGTTNATSGAQRAWTIADRNSATPPAWTTVLYEPGDYSGTTLTADNANVIDDVRGCNMTSADLVSTGSWVATGVNAEWKYTGVASNKRRLLLTEDRLKMTGLSLALSQQNCTVTNVTGNTIRLEGFGFQLTVGDQIWMTSASLIGLTMGTTYYIVTAGALTETATDVWEQDVTLSASPTLTPVITPTVLAGTPRFWTLFNSASSDRRYGIPTPGRLLPGEYAFIFEGGVPVIYMRPSTGVPADHVYHIQTLNSVGYSVALAARNTHVLGGTLFNSCDEGVTVSAQQCGVWGSEVVATNDGVIATNSSGLTIACAYLHDQVGHQSVSVDTSNAESGSRLYSVEFGEVQEKELEFGDAQAYITSPGSRGNYAYDILSYACGRVFGTPVPENVAPNIAIIGWDSCSEQTINRAHIEAVPGAVVVASPSQNPQGTGTRAGSNDNQLINSVIDCRASLSTEKQMLLRLVTTGSGPYSNGGHVFEGNLYLLGDLTQQDVDAPSAFSVKNTQAGTTNGTIAANATLRNNVFYGGSGVGSAYIVTQTDGIGSATVTTAGNIFCGPSIEFGAKNYVSGGSLTTTALAAMTGYGGGPNLVKSDVEMSALYGSDGRPLAAARGLGVFRTPRVDAEGKRRVETTPGPVELVGLAA